MLVLSLLQSILISCLYFIKGTSLDAKKAREDESHPAEENRQHYLPANYATFIQFFKFMMKFLLIVLGLG